MKKRIFVYMIFFLILTGCHTKIDNFLDISFEQAENIVSENIDFLIQETKGMTSSQNYGVDCGLLSNDESLQLDMNIKITGNFDQNKNERFDINPDIYFLDKKEKKEVWTSGQIENIYVEGKYFTRLSSININMGKGNYESNLRYMIMENLGEKRINYESDKFDNIKNIQKNISFIINTLSSSSVFENLEQVTYEGKLAYKISIKANTIDFIKSQTNIEISGFDGLLIVKNENQVDLKINNMSIKDYSNDSLSINIQGIIGGENGEIIYSIEGEKIDIVYDIHRKYTNITIKKFINFDEIFSLNLTIYPSQKKEISKYDFRGSLSISPIFIYGSDLENEIKINIKCLYENFSGEILDIKEPDSYILLDQILGDEFSIKNFIGD